jgi:hypothetical protein
MFLIWPFRSGIPLQQVDYSTAFAVELTAVGWTTLVMSIGTRLAYNLMRSDRRRSSAIESFFLVAALMSLVWLAISFAHFRQDD